ncbi:NYN domain-containing protein [Parathalassolituus penaei]|uniref:NYN domain-containing protein n=1 Tax=Parathalassolituus penaei TaxID=2997323 RepID=A0A9X3EH69_9GAMM|nr:NYN domain-containing protein [Parathalassolituus penaei]MCY0966679.1 NYN domain-containing protein [Parathalassolituus penaei]
MVFNTDDDRRMIRIGVFYDGNYFSHVSNYYLYQHARKARISISGLHQFIVNEIAREENCDSRRCRIVDAHYFRGRLSAYEAQSRNSLYGERLFEEVLMREGIISHFLPLSNAGEKGIDVWFALEAFELTIHKRFDVVVLIAGDSDYLPLIRKINTLGSRVMVLGWDFSFTDDQGNERSTHTSQAILEEANYPLVMSDVIEDRSRRSDVLIDGLFVQARRDKSHDGQGDVRESRYERELRVEAREPRQESRPETRAAESRSQSDSGVAESGGRKTVEGTILNLHNGYGFIRPHNEGDNLFFHYTDLQNVDFNSLWMGDIVMFDISSNQKGPCAKNIFRRQGRHSAGNGNHAASSQQTVGNVASVQSDQSAVLVADNGADDE